MGRRRGSGVSSSMGGSLLLEFASDISGGDDGDCVFVFVLFPDRPPAPVPAVLVISDLSGICND